MTWRSFLSSPWMSLMTWTVPLGSVSTADSRAISAMAESTLGNRPDRAQGDQLVIAVVLTLGLVVTPARLSMVLGSMGRERG